MKRIIASVLILMLLLLSGCSLPTIALTEYNSTPEDDFASFISLLNSGKYDDASKYLSNYSSLGFSTFDDEPVYNELLSALNASRSFSIMGSSSIQGYNASMRIEFTTLDFRTFSNALSEKTLENINEIHYNTGAQLTDEQIGEIMIETLNEMMLSPAEYYTTQIFDLDFRYSDEVWKIHCTNEFYSALIGYIV